MLLVLLVPVPMLLVVIEAAVAAAATGSPRPSQSDAHPPPQMLKFCSRPLLTVWFDTPVAQLFRDMKVRQTRSADPICI